MITLGKLFRRFSLSEKVISVSAAALILFLIIKIALSFGFERSLEKGGIYVEGLIGKPNLLNPVFADFNDVDRDISALLFSGLIKYDPEVRNFFPDLAASIDRSQDNLTYFIHLRNEVFWHDGEKFGMDDVLFTYQTVIQNPDFKNSLLNQAFSDVTIEKIDDDTLSFTLPEVNSFFISFLTVGILPRHILGDTPIDRLEKHPFNKKPVGTGPFRISRNQGAVTDTIRSLTLARFDDYYGEKPKLKSVRLSFYKSWDYLLREKNTLHGIPKIASHEIKTKLTDERLAINSYHLPQYVAAFFNLEKPLLDNKRFRQTLFKSVSKTELAKLLNGEVSPIDTPYFNQFPEQWINQYDLEASSKILEELGFIKGGDGLLRDSKDQTPTFTLLARKIPGSPQDEEIEKVSNFLKTSWEKLGMQINVRREEGENFSILLKKREYDMILLGHSLGYNNDSFSFWHSSKRDEKGINLSQLKSFKIDSILEDLRRVFIGSRKSERLKDLEKTLMDETPALFLYTPIYGFAIDRSVTDLTPPSQLAFPSERFWNISNWHISKVTLAK